jgi:hypothetical protein
LCGQAYLEPGPGTGDLHDLDPPLAVCRIDSHWKVELIAGVGHLDPRFQSAVLLAGGAPAQAGSVAASEPGVEESSQAAAYDLLGRFLEVAPGGRFARQVRSEAAHGAQEGLVADGAAVHVQQGRTFAVADRGVGGIEGVHSADDRDRRAESARGRAALTRLEPASRLGPQLLPEQAL